MACALSAVEESVGRAYQENAGESVPLEPSFASVKRCAKACNIFDRKASRPPGSVADRCRLSVEPPGSTFVK
jgi:hypothetical protein